MNTKQRNRKLTVTVSYEAYQALQTEAVRIDRHTTNVASEVVEAALLSLAYQPDDECDQTDGNQ